ncbi:MAG: hypothetical protein IKO01_10955 [Kiritimatiellae bacterium]|nr:hypothetical protein [Kiritimatiellia bacterium]
MSDSKITVSLEEIDQATPVPGPMPPPFVSPDGPEEAPKPPPGTRAPWIIIAVAVAIVVLGVVCFSLFSAASTADAYLKRYVQSVNAELSDPSSRLRKSVDQRIGAAHLTVTVKDARVVGSEVTTFDGTNAAGKGGENIDKMALVIRFDWDGLTTGGYSDMLWVIDGNRKHLVKSEIIETSASINLEDPDFWGAVGDILLALWGA